MDRKQDLIAQTRLQGKVPIAVYVGGPRNGEYAHQTNLPQRLFALIHEDGRTQFTETYTLATDRTTRGVYQLGEKFNMVGVTYAIYLWAGTVKSSRRDELLRAIDGTDMAYTERKDLHRLVLDRYPRTQELDKWPSMPGTIV